MSANRWMLVLTSSLLCAALVLVSNHTTSAQDTDDRSSAPADVMPDFDGKIVVVVVDESSALETKASTRSLVSPRLEKIGGRYFLRGAYHVPERYKSSMRGVDTGILWDNVHTFMAFTPEQMEEYIAEREKNND